MSLFGGTTLSLLTVSRRSDHSTLKYVANKNNNSTNMFKIYENFRKPLPSYVNLDFFLEKQAWYPDIRFKRDSRALFGHVDKRTERWVHVCILFNSGWGFYRDLA